MAIKWWVVPPRDFSKMSMESSRETLENELNRLVEEAAEMRSIVLRLRDEEIECELIPLFNQLAEKFSGTLVRTSSELQQLSQIMDQVRSNIRDHFPRQEP